MSEDELAREFGEWQHTGTEECKNALRILLLDYAPGCITSNEIDNTVVKILVLIDDLWIREAKR